jgi:SAM-dependent methyltransferase
MELKDLYKNIPYKRLKILGKQIQKQQGINDDNYHNGLKYLLKMNLYLEEKLKCLDYIESVKPGTKSFLDIGSGSGFWEFICRSAGHTCVSTNEKEYPIFKETMDVLNIDCKFFRAYIDEGLGRIEHDLDLGSKFDVITAQRSVFNYYPRDWSTLQWLTFLQGCNDLLNDDGIVFIKTNYSAGEKVYQLPEDVRRTFEPFQVSGMNAVTWCFPKSKIAEIDL